MAGLQEWAQAEQVAYLVPFVREKGYHWCDIARRFGLPPEAEKLKNRKIDLKMLLGAFEHVAELVGDDAVVFDLYSELPQGAIPIFDYVALCAPTVRMGLQNWQRFISLRTNCYTMEFTEDADYGYLTWQIPDRYGPRTQNMFAKIAWATSRIEQMVQDPAPDLRIQLTCPEPTCTSEFQKRLGSRLKFNQSVDRISIPAHYLDLAPPKTEANLYALVEAAALSEIQANVSRTDPILRIKTAINEHLKTGTCTLEQVAESVGKSQRSLQRVLELHGTSFRQLTDDIRRSIAARYLQESDLSLKEIAFLLGFSNLSSFSRAVKGWYGTSPSQMRKRKHEH
ncbi:MAG: helix-turn-helix domain-containing protein [Roseibium sp.]|nr:helix-turn-helix domain-containing protein [Roseibium sp.]